MSVERESHETDPAQAVTDHLLKEYGTADLTPRDRASSAHAAVDRIHGMDLPPEAALDVMKDVGEQVGRTSGLFAGDILRREAVIAGVHHRRAQLQHRQLYLTHPIPEILSAKGLSQRALIIGAMRHQFAYRRIITSYAGIGSVNYKSAPPRFNPEDH